MRRLAVGRLMRGTAAFFVARLLTSAGAISRLGVAGLRRALIVGAASGGMRGGLGLAFFRGGF